MTDPPALPALPSPAYRDQGQCREGCFTNEQMRDALDAVLAWGLKCVDSLHGIRVFSDEEADRINKGGKKR